MLPLRKTRYRVQGSLHHFLQVPVTQQLSQNQSLILKIQKHLKYEHKKCYSLSCNCIPVSFKKIKRNPDLMKKKKIPGKQYLVLWEDPVFCFQTQHGLSFGSWGCWRARANAFYTPQVTTLQLFTLFPPKQLLKWPQPSSSGHILIDGQSAMEVILSLADTMQSRLLWGDRCQEDQHDQHKLPSFHKSGLPGWSLLRDYTPFVASL